eukprot:SAG31_NODE_24293_length_485_cov_0.562176_1_plen_122_part_01
MCISVLSEIWSAKIDTDGPCVAHPVAQRCVVVLSRAGQTLTARPKLLMPAPQQLLPLLASHAVRMRSPIARHNAHCFGSRGQSEAPLTIRLCFPQSCRKDHPLYPVIARIPHRAAHESIRSC